MSRLTAEQQRLVVEHLPFAEEWAIKTHSPLPIEERRSAAYYGLCLAVQSQPKGIGYTKWAYYVVRNRIIDDGRRCLAWRRLNSVEWDVEHPTTQDSTPARILALLLRLRFHRLSDRERIVLELYCQGQSWADIARQLKITEPSTIRIRWRAAAKLLA